MIKFYYHYDKDLHKAKIVAEAPSGEVVENFIEKIICAVHTETERKDTPPRFVVRGTCKEIKIIGETIYIS